MPGLDDVPGDVRPLEVLPGLAGQVAVVTGAGSQGEGIGNGRAAAVLLAEAGARVLLVDAVEERLRPTADLVAATGGTSISVVADVGDEADCKAAVHRAFDAWGRVDVLVNNVGIMGPARTVLDIDLNDWDRCFRVNVTSVMLMSRYAIPYMRRQGGGSIVNVSSLAGTLSHPRPAYAASKGAMLSLTRSMASVHGAEGIRVNAIAPGMVYTPLPQAEGLTPEAREARAAAAPLRTEGTGWDIGHAVVFLAGPASRWISGVTLPVDGGFSADIRLSPEMSVTRANA